MLRAFLLSVVTLFFLTACSSKPKVTDANNYLIIQTELVKLKNYREAILSCREELICTPDSYKPNLTEPPAPNFIELTSYLNKNDCSVLRDKAAYDACYKETRLRLIQTTEKLDGAEIDNYVLNRTVDRMIRNIDAIINGFPKVEALDGK